jgi:rhodanese-related sulfurtransferase
MELFRSTLVRQAGAILGAALCLGVAYNASSPLGVQSPPATAPLITVWPEVKALLAQHRIVLVDARRAAAYEAGHIPGAVSLPFPELERRIAEFSRQHAPTQPLVIYCESLDCPDAHAEAAALAAQYGYGNVREMPGGYAEWRQAEADGTARP